MSVLCRCRFVPARFSQTVAHGCSCCPNAYLHEKNAESAKISRISATGPVHGPANPKKQSCPVILLSVHKKSASLKETLTHINVIPMSCPVAQRQLFQLVQPPAAQLTHMLQDEAGKRMDLQSSHSACQVTDYTGLSFIG